MVIDLISQDLHAPVERLGIDSDAFGIKDVDILELAVAELDARIEENEVCLLFLVYSVPI